jgi:hypothetical protein
MKRLVQRLASVEDTFRPWRIPFRRRAWRADVRRRKAELGMLGLIVTLVLALGGEGRLVGSPPSAPAAQPESTPSGDLEPRLGGFQIADRKTAIVSALNESGKPWRELSGGMILVEGNLDEALAPGASFFLLRIIPGDRLVSVEALWPFVSKTLPPDVLRAKQTLTGKLGSPRRTGELDVYWRIKGYGFALLTAERRLDTGPSRFWILRLEQ